MAQPPTGPAGSGRAAVPPDSGDEGDDGSSHQLSSRIGDRTRNIEMTRHADSRKRVRNIEPAGHWKREPHPIDREAALLGIDFDEDYLAQARFAAEVTECEIESPNHRATTLSA